MPRRSKTLHHWLLGFLLSVMIAIQFGSMVILHHRHSQQQQQQQQHNNSNSWMTRFHNSNSGSSTNLHPQQQQHLAKNPNTPPPGCSLQHYNLSDDACVEYLAYQLARPWTRKPFPSSNHFNNNSTTPYSKSCRLTLIKVPKSASSTVASIVLRLGYQYADCFGINATHVDWQHGTAREKYQQQHQKEQQHRQQQQQPQQLSWRVAPIRDPSSRALSDIYYHRVSLHKVHQGNKKNLDQQQQESWVSAKWILRGLRDLPDNYFTEYTRPPSASVDDNAIAIIQSILHHYDFLVDVTNMETSLIVWAWLWGVDWSDVFVADSKRSSSWYAVGNRCVSLISPPKPRRTQHNDKEQNDQQQPTDNDPMDPVFGYLESLEWKERQGMDRLLSATVQVSLEMTRQVMIREMRSNNNHHFPIPASIHKLISTSDTADNDNDSWWASTLLPHWRQLRAQVSTACSDETHFPCSPTGVLQRSAAQASCYVRDFGCGHACHDRVWRSIHHNDLL